MPNTSWDIDTIHCPHCNNVVGIEEWGVRSETRVAFYIERDSHGTYYVDTSDEGGGGDYEADGYFCGSCGGKLANGDQELGALLERLGIITPNINSIEEIE